MVIELTQCLLFCMCYGNILFDLTSPLTLEGNKKEIETNRAKTNEKKFPYPLQYPPREHRNIEVSPPGPFSEVPYRMHNG